jgi:hypothetical protein
MLEFLGLLFFVKKYGNFSQEKEKRLKGKKDAK